MRFLLVVKQKRNAEAFVGTMRALVERGHTVALAVQDTDEKRDERLAAALNAAGVQAVRCPSARMDEWSDVAALVRRLRDAVHYLRPSMRSAAKLRARALDRLRQDLQFEGDTPGVAHGLQTIPPSQVLRLEDVFALAEQSLPSDPLFDEFLASQQPDVLLVSPLIHFGSAQADLVTSAQRLRIPVWMLLYSWDNLSTKGCMHRAPDRIFVWNEQQRREAQALHDFPSERVTVVGAPRFDEFFALRPLMTRAEFHEPLGLDPARPTLLYVCSSRFVSAQERPFVERWLRALRGSGSEALRSCNVVVRPHPDIPILPDDARLTRHRWPAAPELTAKTARLFDDPAAVVLQTDFGVPQGLYESITHSTAVVGLNTTAELEAAIIGRPVFTVVADDPVVDGQSTTLHFHYLTKEHGGIVSPAATFDEHLAQLDAALTQPADPAPVRAFVESFLRPHGIDRPVAPLFAAALEQAASGESQIAERAGQPVVESDRPRPASAATVERATMPVGDDGLSLRVYATAVATHVAREGRVPLDPATVTWLEQEVAAGDVVYDIGAGIGEYVLLAAKRRGAIVVAFEPAYNAYGELCENVLLNGCEATVVPIALALAARDGLAEIKYEHGRPGEPGYAVRDDIEWRVKHRGRNKPYLQPACLVRLDTVVAQYRLPAPNHLRISPAMAAEAVLAGAAATLGLPSVRSTFLNGKADILVRRT
ncbi:MAG: FkbM family methyltransferase [Acidimicrobiia bacterium]|nr:FkbM family methyltransferase [Acidimicrobiia bacterium]